MMKFYIETMNITKILLAAAVIMSLAACSGKKETACTTETVKRQDVFTTITATGTIEPVTKVQVGTQVSGIIAKLYVDYNSVVKKGQVIAELDKTNLLSELASAQSNLSNAQSNLNFQKSNFNRYKTLFEKGLVSANDFENAKLTYEQAVQQVNVQKMSVQKAQTNLGYATITAPIDGVVLSREVEEGQTVAAAMNTPTLFNIAQDLTNMRVIADIDEADIGGVKEGQRVTFTVDAYPDDVFNGTVQQVRQNATTQSNVVTYQAVITAPNADLKLKPGLTANVTIYTMEHRNVVTVTNQSLHFNPLEELLNEGQSIEPAKGNGPKVWTLEGNVFKSHAVKVGITNGALTEIVSGVKEGMVIITDYEMEEEVAAPAPTLFGPKPRGNKKEKENDKK